MGTRVGGWGWRLGSGLCGGWVCGLSVVVRVGSEGWGGGYTCSVMLC